MTLICAVGPARVHTLAGATGVDADPVAGRAALRGGDDHRTLLGDRPVTVEDAWRTALRPLLAGPGDHPGLLLVHPGSWPLRRARLVAAVAAELGAAPIQTVSRSALLAQADSVIIEIGCRDVLLTHCRSAGDLLPIALVERCGSPATVAETISAKVRCCRVATVLVDAPPGVPGATELAAIIAEQLDGDHRVQAVTGAALTAAAGETLPPAPDRPAQQRPRSRTTRLAAALLVSLVLITVAAHTFRRPGPSTGPITTLIEGRVAVQIPAEWSVRRVTGGAGSARVEIISPQDGNDVVHLTQARSGTDPAGTAAALRRVVEAETDGVFTDFTPDIERAGRPAISYRELRPGREIFWTVLADAELRIGIGCQGAPGARSVIDEVCRAAVDSVRRIG